MSEGEGGRGRGGGTVTVVTLDCRSVGGSEVVSPRLVLTKVYSVQE